MNDVLRLVDRWCPEVPINLSKVRVGLFTLRGFVPLRLQGSMLVLWNLVKFLGFILDRSLHWGPQFQKVIDQGKKSLFAWRQLGGGTWGLKLILMHWHYVSMVRSPMIYMSSVWWSKLIRSKRLGFGCISETGLPHYLQCSKQLSRRFPRLYIQPDANRPPH